MTRLRFTTFKGFQFVFKKKTYDESNYVICIIETDSMLVTFLHVVSECLLRKVVCKCILLSDFDSQKEYHFTPSMYIGVPNELARFKLRILK